MCALADACPGKIAKRLILVLDGRAIDDEAVGGEEDHARVDELPEAHDPASASAEALAVAVGDKQPAESTLASIMAGLPGETSRVEASPVEPAPESPDIQEYETVQPEHHSGALRIVAASLLAGLHDPDTAVIRALRRAFDTGAPAIRRAALQALITIGGSEAGVVIQDAAGDDDMEVRLASLEGLPANTASADLPACLAELAVDPEACVRARAIAVLGQTDAAPELSKLICAAMQDESMDVCRAALGALDAGNCTDESVESVYRLMFRFSAELRHEAAKALRRSGDITCTSRLLASLQDETQEEIHWICIDALADLHATDSASVH